MSDPTRTFLERFTESLKDGGFVRLALTQPVNGGGRPERILGRLVELRGEPHLSLTLRHATKDLTRNLPVREAAEWLRSQLGPEFRGAVLGTTAKDWQWNQRRNGVAQLIAHKPAKTAAPARTHDRQKPGVLADSARDWLSGLGVTDANGKVRIAMSDKHRQINRYLEILSHLARDCGWMASEGQTTREPVATGSSGEDGDSLSSSLRNELVLADMGCGKGYLTFGAWQLFHRQLGQRVRILGIEQRPELVESGNLLVRQIGAAGLEFVPGTIESVNLPRLDALIALHACNTATDASLRRGIELGAKLLIVAPCCHQELRPQLGRPEPLAAILRHGIMEERLAEWLTDGLRALFLEWAGYRTKLMEFVSTEHTPKNLMLAAVRDPERKPFADAATRARIVELMKFFGVKHHTLDSLLAGAEVTRLTSTVEKS